MFTCIKIQLNKHKRMQINEGAAKEKQKEKKSKACE